MDNMEKMMQEIEAEYVNTKENEKEKTQNKVRFEPKSVSEIIKIKFESTPWLVENLIPSKCITILSGAPASYKTWLLLQMAIKIAQGEKFLGQFKCEKAGVLIINEEDHLRLIQERLNKLGAEEDLSINVISQENFAVLEDKDLEEIIKVCEAKDANVIFIDSLVRISDNDENDAKQMSKVFRNIRKFCQAGKTVVLTHHERKEGFVKSSAQARLRGSSDIPASIDSHLAIQRDKKDKTKLRFEQAKNRFSQEIEPILIRVVTADEKVDFNIEDGVFDEKEEDVREAIIEILKESTETGLLTKEVAEKVKILVSVSAKKVAEILKDMTNDNEIICKSGNKNEKRYFLAKEETEEEES